jgi:hypothetical protein
MITATATPVTDQQKPDMFRTISLTALLAGTLDILAAIVKFYLDTGNAARLKLAPGDEAEPVSFFTYIANGGPNRIFKYIASGVFGKEPTISEELLVTWGIVFHFMIAFLFTAFLFVIYPRVIRFLKNKFITGFVFGIFVWAVMNLAVVPIFVTDRLPSPSEKMIVEALILIAMIGIPVALIAHGHYRSKKQV